MRKKWFAVLVIILLALTACSPQAEPADTPAEEPAPIEESASAEDPAEAEESAEEASPTEAPPPTETPVPEIVHWEFPGDFKETPLQRIYDCVMGKQTLYGEELALNPSCDQWENNYFERPVNEGMEDFYPQLDIVESAFGADKSWYYVQIQVFAEQVENLVLDGVYAVEIDLTLDARGEILIMAVNPALNPLDEWSSAGVQVWLDENDDVGGPEAMAVDPRYEGDGYEQLIFDSGLGDDPDLAYVRLSSEVPGLIEFGFKIGLLGGTESFEWWAWAMAEDLSAAKYDPVDFFPQDSLFALDNTCGWIYGSFARDLPNICETIAGPQPTQTKKGSCEPKTPCFGLWHGWPDCYCEVIN